MARYEITITQEIAGPGDRTRSEAQVLLCQPFAKFGALRQWCQDWYKTTGAHRRPRRQGNRIWRPTSHASEEFFVDMNWTRSFPYDAPEYQEPAFLAEVRPYSGCLPYGFRKPDPYGRRLIEIYYPNATGARVVTLWAKVIEDEAEHDA